MKAADRVRLERRMAEERMTELQPHGEAPEWRWQFDGWSPRTWTMDEHGVLSARSGPLDEVDWRGVVAVKCEQWTGSPINLESLGEDEGY